MTSATYVAGDVSIVRKVTWQKCVAVTWANQRWTHGIFWLDGMNESSVDTWHASVGCEGATWPNHRLPRGTPDLANEDYVKSFGVRGIRTPDLSIGFALTNYANHYTTVCALIAIRQILYLMWFELYM